MKKYIGIDGCRRGWVAAVLGDRLELIFSETLEEVRGLVVSSTLTLIDMPMGLKSEGQGERVCDVEARKFLKRRKMSIFPVPCRQAVYTDSYRKANEVNREVLGKGLSKQSYNLFPKIREVDSFITKDSEILKRIIEGHPEISFGRTSGMEMEHNKRSLEGFQERLEAIEKFLPGAAFTVESFMKKTQEICGSKRRYLGCHNPGYCCFNSRGGLSHSSRGTSSRLPWDSHENLHSKDREVVT